MVTISYHPRRRSHTLHPRRIGACLLACLLIWVHSPAHAAAVSAQLDRTTIHEDETVSLIISASGDVDGQPDLQPLERDFEILGSSQSSRVNIINGRVDSRKEWVIQLMPLHKGTLTIPALTVGPNRTRPAQLLVKAMDDTKAATSDADIFLDVETDKIQSYVQEQIILTIRLFHAVALRDGSLSKPQVADALLERLGEDKRYKTRRNNKTYEVIERRFAVFPQQSGPLAINPIIFSGKALDTRRNSGSRLDRLFGRDPFGDPFDMLTPTTTVRTRSQTIDLNIKPQPTSAQGQAWLPTSHLSLKESWSPKNPQFRVGEPVTRTIEIRADGLTGSQLPDLPVAQLDNVNSYPDKSETHNQVSPGGIAGTRTIKRALVPTHAGEFTLPAIQLTWWDIGSDTPRTARLPEQTISVTGATGQASQTAPAPDAAVTGKSATATIPDTTEMQPIDNPTTAASRLTQLEQYWPWLTGFFLLAWLLTLMLWLRARRRSAVVPARITDGAPDNAKAATLKTGRRAVQLACKTNHAPRVRDALLRWGRVNWSDNPPRNLTELAERLEDATARQAIRELDAFLYSSANSNWRGDVCWKKLSSGLNAASNAPRRATDDGLPALYPG